MVNRYIRVPCTLRQQHGCQLLDLAAPVVHGQDGSELLPQLIQLAQAAAQVSQGLHLVFLGGVQKLH